MARRTIVTIGASAGGIEALGRVVRGLPPDIPAAIVVVVHISEYSVLPAVLQRASPLPTAHARDGEVPRPGRIYVAPPGVHLLLEDDHLRLRHGPRENGARPAIDPLFRSAARSVRDRVVGVILSGQLDDGVAGLYAIKARGGLAIVQDPEDAAAPSMPSHALRLVDVDFRAPANQIGPLLAEIANEETMSTKSKRRGSERAASAAKRVIAKAVAGRNGVPMRGRDQDKIGERHRARPPESPEQDPLRCPDCSGPLYRVSGGDLEQWSCREGHVFSPDSLSSAQTDALERALWLAVRTMKERALIDRTISQRGETSAPSTRARLAERAHATEHDVALLREILARL
ncbi:MAG TPA: chemotaxis protein CheB [Polyangia bacterium]|jgi:two-component system chemotaxis response regulator CheB|nr:chemotaxis protein CheB [Polyangia bacterium]